MTVGSDRSGQFRYLSETFGANRPCDSDEALIARLRRISAQLAAHDLNVHVSHIYNAQHGYIGPTLRRAAIRAGWLAPARPRVAFNDWGGMVAWVNDMAAVWGMSRDELLHHMASAWAERYGMPAPPPMEDKSEQN